MAKRHGVDFWQGHLAAWRRSDLTQKAYCAGHGLSTESLRRWWRREKQEAIAARPSLTLVPVSVVPPATGSTVQLHSPGGWRIELPGSNVPWLADLLRQLP